MSTAKRPRGKKFFTAAEANATLPLVRAIVKDITELAATLRDRQERLERLGDAGQGSMGEAYREELEMLQDEQDRGEERMREYLQELHALGVELKDYYAGLVDFPAWMNDHEVYLCWRLGEPEVAYWHEIDAGFKGRQKLLADAHTS
jgi:hypothetical protein